MTIATPIARILEIDGRLRDAIGTEPEYALSLLQEREQELAALPPLQASPGEMERLVASTDELHARLSHWRRNLGHELAEIERGLRHVRQQGGDGAMQSNWSVNG